ncbi:MULTISPECIES: hypothetical protein [Pseudomonas]|uniref:Uncharacterized protein n=1 Tax=Pseudomonas lutea TaxID=243924 RepID=A0A9X8MHR5_9PSED|nr:MULTISPECIES: hypothetical protein [Pseudomonas]SER49031.1 hypothetical protein SAMN05216409_1288 [Pseudomonas lutea]
MPVNAAVLADKQLSKLQQLPPSYWTPGEPEKTDGFVWLTLERRYWKSIERWTVLGLYDKGSWYELIDLDDGSGEPEIDQIDDRILSWASVDRTMSVAALLLNEPSPDLSKPEPLTYID